MTVCDPTLCSLLFPAHCSVIRALLRCLLRIDLFHYTYSSQPIYMHRIHITHPTTPGAYALIDTDGKTSLYAVCMQGAF